MNKYISSAAISLLALASVIPTVTQAETLTIPVGARGISEATYQELKAAECRIPGGAEGGGDVLDCDAIVYEFVETGMQEIPTLNYGETIVFRANAAGQLYRVDVSGIGPVLKRYLPDGFYKSNHKYYWVADNKKVRVTKASAYHRLMQRVQLDNEAYTPVSESDFNLLNTVICEGNLLDTDEIDEQYENCKQDLIDREPLVKKLQRQIIMRADAEGQLYYLPQPNDGEIDGLDMPIDINETYSSGETLFSFVVKPHTVKVSSSVIQQIARY